MDVLITDSAKSETSHLVQEILRMYIIEAKQSEPHYQHQNPFERRSGVIKRSVNKLMNLIGAPAEMWLLALEHVCMVMNCTATESLGWQTPLEKLTGVTPNISVPYSVFTSTSPCTISAWMRVFPPSLRSD